MIVCSIIDYIHCKLHCNRDVECAAYSIRKNRCYLHFTPCMEIRSHNNELFIKNCNEQLSKLKCVL